MSAADSKPTGRRALVVAAAVGGCAIAAAAVGPTLAVVLGPAAGHGGGGRWIRAAKLDQLRDGQPRRVAIVSDRHDAWMLEKDVELGSVWLLRRGDRVEAFSSVCPHLGCSVNAVTGSDGQGEGFACPCHTSAFDANGKRVSGPAPRDMDELETKIEDGQVMVDFRRFRIGVEEKVEA